jgi:hypothetical protein
MEVTVLPLPVVLEVTEETIHLVLDQVVVAKAPALPQVLHFHTITLGHMDQEVAAEVTERLRRRRIMDLEQVVVEMVRVLLGLLVGLYSLIMHT